jgi:hypothetical protein
VFDDVDETRSNRASIRHREPPLWRQDNPQLLRERTVSASSHQNGCFSTSITPASQDSYENFLAFESSKRKISILRAASCSEREDLMRRMIAALGLSLAMTGSASAAIEQFHARLGLTGAQEAPTPVVTPGGGSGTATYDSVANTLSVNVTFSGLTSNTNNAHIHCCALINNSAPIAVDFVAPGFPLGVTSGSWSHTFNLGLASTYTAGFISGSTPATPDGARDRLLGSMRLPVGSTVGLSYFNIHTTTNPGGELRGNISPVPEPAAVLLALCGLAAAACLQRKR